MLIRAVLGVPMVWLKAPAQCWVCDEAVCEGVSTLQPATSSPSTGPTGGD